MLSNCLFGTKRAPATNAIIRLREIGTRSDLSNKGNWHAVPFFIEWDLLSGRPSQEALHDWAIGFALGQGRGIAVLVHCGGNMRVSDEFLLHSHGCCGLVQPLTICVTERMKPDPAKSQFQTCRNQVVGAHRVGMIRSTRHRARFGIETERLPFLEFEDKAPFDRNLVLRILRLQLVEPLSDR
jgi:hypothetical protein